MSFVRVAFFPRATQAHFDALGAALRDAPVPSGRLLFAAGPVAGGWQVVQVWSAAAGLDDYNREHFLPALASLGPAAFPAPPVVTDFTPTTLLLGDRGAPPAP